MKYQNFVKNWYEKGNNSFKKIATFVIGVATIVVDQDCNNYGLSCNDSVFFCDNGGRCCDNGGWCCDNSGWCDDIEHYDNCDHNKVSQSACKQTSFNFNCQKNTIKVKTTNYISAEQ